MTSRTGLHAGQVIAGRYRIEAMLGEGGMGAVYRATQLSLDRAVALKVMLELPGDNLRLEERFEREAAALARLAHPSTVRLFDFGRTERGCPFLVMELLEGADLEELLRRRGRLECAEALHVTAQVLRSLEEAHAAGLLHRDIKPANIFVCAASGGPRVKVLDFGIAGMTAALQPAARLTRTGVFVGSAPYMSPEQARGDAVGPATDLYAAGVVLFEMLTGATPFREATLTALLLAKVNQPAPALTEVCPSLVVPREVRELVAELLLRDAGQRPSAASAVAERIEALLGREDLSRRSRAPALVASTTGALVAPRAAPVETARTEPMPAPLALRELPLAKTAPMAGSAPRDARRWTASWRGLAAVLVLLTFGGALVALIRGGAERSEARQLNEDEQPKSAASAQTELALQPDEDVPAPQNAEHTARPNASTPDAAAPTQPRPRVSASARSLVPRRQRRTQPPAPPSPAEPQPRPAPITPSASPPQPEPSPTTPAPREPAVAAPAPLERPAPSEPGRTYPTVAAVVAARDAGEISQLQSNRMILELRRQQFEARSQLGRDYKEGRITLEQLKAGQLAIDERFEGR